MLLPKEPRIKNKKLLYVIKRVLGHCEVCGNTFALEAHHIKSKGAGGNDTADNLIVLCRECHRKAHDGNIGRDRLKAIVLKRRDVMFA